MSSCHVIVNGIDGSGKNVKVLGHFITCKMACEVFLYECFALCRIIWTEESCIALGIGNILSFFCSEHTCCSILKQVTSLEEVYLLGFFLWGEAMISYGSRIGKDSILKKVLWFDFLRWWWAQINIIKF